MEMELRDRIVEAVSNNDLESMKNLLSDGADPNTACDIFGNTLLHKAIESPKAVSLLIDAGADVNKKNIYWISPIYAACACKAPKIETISTLLSKGAVINERNIFGTMALHAICANPEADMNMLKVMLDAGADPNMKDRDGRTPLSTAVSLNYRNNVVCILESGKCTFDTCKEAAEIASARGFIDLAEMLHLHMKENNADREKMIGKIVEMNPLPSHKPKTENKKMEIL